MKMLLSLVLLALTASGARAGFILGTSNPPGTPLVLSGGSSSGPMFVTVTSTGSPNDMADWQFRLVIIADVGSTGGLTFQTPGIGNSTPPNPPSYIFGNHGAGISATVGSGGTQLDANDFDNNLGTSISGSANLLQVSFTATSSASGVFGIYAVRGSARTLWDDGLSTNNPQFFSNVPNGSGTVRIGEVSVQTTGPVTPAPAPSGLTLIILGVITLIACSAFNSSTRSTLRVGMLLRTLRALTRQGTTRSVEEHVPTRPNVLHGRALF